jgi:hypothetical protein
MVSGGRLVSPSAERNKGPIGEILCRMLPPNGRVVEIASGTGQHVVHFANMMPNLTWQPTERDGDCLRSIAGWLALKAPPNVRTPLHLDVHEAPWPLRSADGIVCINMVHIAPWSATQALMRGAGRMLPAAGIMYLYGPYKKGGQHTSASNQAFDAQLRAADPLWGVRDLEEMTKVATTENFNLQCTCEMPANNLSLIFRKG